MFRLVESLDVFLIYFVELAELIHLLLKFFDSVFEHFDVHSGSLFIFPFFLPIYYLFGLPVLENFFCLLINMYITIIPFFNVSRLYFQVKWSIHML